MNSVKENYNLVLARTSEYVIESSDNLYLFGGRGKQLFWQQNESSLLALHVALAKPFSSISRNLVKAGYIFVESEGIGMEMSFDLDRIVDYPEDLGLLETAQMICDGFKKLFVPSSSVDRQDKIVTKLSIAQTMPFLHPEWRGKEFIGISN